MSLGAFFFFFLKLIVKLSSLGFHIFNYVVLIIITSLFILFF